MKEIVATFNERKADLLQAIFEHLAISLSALLIAILIAVPCAILLSKRQKIAEVVLQFTSVLQTIPSLALLGLLIPFVGIGTTPALIALVIYALLPIFQNTYIGNRSLHRRSGGGFWHVSHAQAFEGGSAHGYAHDCLRDSHGFGLNHRYGDFGGFDWGRGLRDFYPTGD